MCVYVCTYVFLNIYFFYYLQCYFVRIFSWLIFWCRQPLDMLFPREDYFSCSQLSSAVHSYLERAEAFVGFPLSSWECSLTSSLLNSHLGSHAGETRWILLEDTISQQTHRSSFWLLQSFLPPRLQCPEP